MKTADVPKAGCCGGAASMLDQVRRVHSMLTMGHQGLASLYTAVAADRTDPEEKAAFTKAAENQVRLAKESQDMTTLDLSEEVEK